MAKFEKSTRDMVDVDQELEKLQGKKKVKKTSTKEEKSSSKKAVTNSKKQKAKKKPKKGFFRAIGEFFHETRKEVSKVKWPSRKEMVKYSVATVCFIIFFAVFFYLIELILALLKMGV